MSSSGVTHFDVIKISEAQIDSGFTETRVNWTRTLHQKRKQVWFEFPEEIPLGYEIMMQMLLENAKIKIFYRGTLTLVYIYTKN